MPLANHPTPAIDALDKSATTPSRQRIGEIDALRGIAVLLVMLYHYCEGYGHWYGHPSPLRFYVNGYIGVQIFFAISGFVIFMTLTRTQSSWRFLFLRFSRLYPAFFVAVGITFAATHLFPIRYRAVPLEAAVLNLTMIPTILGVPEVDGVYWSLGVELTFYLLMAAVFPICLKQRPRACMAAFLLLQAALIPTDRLPFLFDLFKHHMHLFVIGMVTWELRQTDSSDWRAILLLTACGGLGWATGSGWVTLGVLAVFWLHARRLLGWLDCRPLVYLGTISYSLYLTHQNLGFILMHRLYHLGLPSKIVLPTTITLAILLATAMTFLIEKPALNWLRRRAH